MTGRKISKFLFVWLCIITLVMPFTVEVLAAVLTEESTTVVVESVLWRQGGPESTGLKSSNYDERSYSYEVSGKNVLKAIQAGDTNYLDTFYCINAERSLSITKMYDYTKVADDFKDYSDVEVTNWREEVGITEENYKALVWLLENIYVKNQQANLKDSFLEKAFADLIAEEADLTPPTTVEFIKERLTDDDIEVVQQWAMWYFTNGSNEENEYYNALYNAFGQMTVSYEYLDDGELVQMEDVVLDATRQRYAAELYNYLITSAKAAATAEENAQEVKYPSIDKTKNVESTVDGEYYKVGPFKVNSGNVDCSKYTLTLSTVGADIEAVDYKIYVDGEEVLTPYTEIFDKEYYVYIPMAGNTVTKVDLSLNYRLDGEMKASLWEGTDPETSNPSQPLVLLLYVPGDFVYEDISGTIVEKKYDLALRKFIVSVDGDATEGRTPVANVDDLVAGGNVGKYEHAKAPVTVKKGSKIVYEFRVYNEGEIDAKVEEMIDYLPEGLTVVDKTQSTINSKYNWEVVGTTENGLQIVKNTYLSDKASVPAFDKDGKVISYAVVQLECEVTGDFEGGTVLTNLAQVTVDNGLDRDSTADSINPEDIDKTTYSGNKSNKEDLTDSSYFYAGLEDDDDFEKVVIEGEVFDLSLQKFITKVNDEDYKTAREPKVDVDPLVNGSDDAKYETEKTPVQVEVGDVITFTLRVYNEGDVAGYAEQITDYIPEGLGFLLNHKTNYENSWTISQDATSVKLSEVKNGTKNLKVSDFEDVDSLEDVEVVVGKTKVTSTALASSNTSTENLIDAFDVENKKISYKDIEVTCIVVTEDEVALKNIAAITAESDDEREPVEEDRDSKPEDNIVPEDYTTGNEDDDDYDVINTSPKYYDFALQKFITGLNETVIDNREPVVTLDKEGNIKYNHTTEPLTVGNGDLVTYTIRVYNEGNTDGYVSEISDDIPNGLTFLPENETNKEYGWEMYDKYGKETKDINQASQIRTTYLSKENSENNLIKAFDKEAELSSNNPSYKDIKVVFEINELDIERTITTEQRVIVNTAEITEITDSDGFEAEDTDSNPDNGKLEEDDIDQEKVYVKYFDLALEKNLKKIIMVEEGQTKVIDVTDPTALMKVEIHRKKLKNTSIQFVYEIVVRNEGEISGYATEITDYIPQGLAFSEAANTNWSKKADNIISTNALVNTLLAPGEKAAVEVTLDWVKDENNMGKFVNVAEISDDKNEYESEDVDSTPDNLISTEDDQDDAPVYVSIGTGLGGQPYLILTSVVLLILATGIFLIKKYVIE